MPSPILKPIALHINGQTHVLTIEPRWTLARVLRTELGLVGTQLGCDRAECGACTVNINGCAVYACTTLAIQCQDKTILTIEGLASQNPVASSQYPVSSVQSSASNASLPDFQALPPNPRPPSPTLSSLQHAFIAHDALQCGFCTSGFIMAAHALLAHKPKPTVDDIRYALFGNICRCGAYPKIVAAVLAASGQSELARTYERTSRHATTALPPLDVLGTYVGRHEAIDKVTGRADFVSSLHLPQLLHAKVLRSPHAHARIVRIDTTRAAQAPGVVAIITHHDAPQALWSQPDAHIIDDRVRYIGDEIAVVAAASEEQAADALHLIDVEYELLPATFSADALQTNAYPIHQGGNFVGQMKLERGDVAQGFNEAVVTLEEAFHFAPVHSSPLQPRVAMAQWENGALTIWAASRAPFILQERLASVFGLSREAVRVVVNMTGGSYGSKDESRITFLTALLAQKARRPVRLAYTRAEEMTAGRNRPWGWVRLKLGARADGSLTALETQLQFNTGAYASGMHSIGRGAGALFDLYRCAARFSGSMYYTNLPPAGSYRALGAVHTTFAVETLMDRLAEALQMDPIALRLQNAVRAGDPLMQVDGRKLDKPQPLSTSGFEECLQLGAQAIGWERRNTTPQPLQPGTRLRGIGFAPVIYGTGSDESDAEVEILPDGTVGVLSGVSDVGVGTRTVLAMIAAEVLGVSYESVGIRTGDTALPYAPMQAGSRITFSVGWATQMAAESARAQLLKLAEPLFEAASSELEIKRGRVNLKTMGAPSYSFAEIFQFAQRAQRIVGHGHATNTAKPAVQGFGAHFVEVDVDVDTGDVRVLRYVAAHDVGRALNPHGVENQIYGLAQTFGQALHEDLIFDETNGLTLNPDVNQYLIPTVGDFPPIEVIMVETNEPLGPFGAKGIGEPPLPPVAPAIANAIYNAIGIRFNTLPITRDMILQALNQRRANAQL